MLAAALLACVPALAQEAAPERPNDVWLATGFATWHWDSNKNLNDSNPGVGVEYRFHQDMAVTGGRFFNSERRHSRYAGLVYQPFEVGGVRLGAMVGGFDGYRKMHGGGWFAAAVPALSFESKRVGVNMAVVPTYKDKVHGGISVQLKFKVWE